MLFPRLPFIWMLVDVPASLFPVAFIILLLSIPLLLFILLLLLRASLSGEFPLAPFYSHT